MSVKRIKVYAPGGGEIEIFEDKLQNFKDKGWSEKPPIKPQSAKTVKSNIETEEA